MLKKEIMDLPRAQAVMEVFAWYSFYTRRTIFYFVKPNNDDLCWDFYPNLLNQNKLPLFFDNRNVPYFHAPDKLLEDVARMGTSFLDMCRSFGWIKTDDCAEAISAIIKQCFINLGLHFDCHTNRLQKDTPILYRFNFFHRFDDRNINDNCPIKDPDFPRVPTTLGNILLGNLASDIDKKWLSIRLCMNILFREVVL